MADDTSPIPESVTGSIDAVLEMEHRADRDRPTLARLAHAIGEFVGSVPFAALHIAAFIAWLLLNSGLWPHLAFDPYPYALLGTLVSCEAVMLTTFVLIKQNREGERAEKRSHLDLQGNLLTEREVTKVLQIVQRLSDQAGLPKPQDAELNDMLEQTGLKSLAAHMDDRHAGFRSET